MSKLLRIWIRVLGLLVGLAIGIELMVIMAYPDVRVLGVINLVVLLVVLVEVEILIRRGRLS